MRNFLTRPFTVRREISKTIPSSSGISHSLYGIVSGYGGATPSGDSRFESVKIESCSAKVPRLLAGPSGKYRIQGQAAAGDSCGDLSGAGQVECGAPPPGPDRDPCGNISGWAATFVPDCGFLLVELAGLPLEKLADGRLARAVMGALQGERVGGMKLQEVQRIVAEIFD